MIETQGNGYSSDSTHRELSNEYQHDRVKMILIILCFCQTSCSVSPSAGIRESVDFSIGRFLYYSLFSQVEKVWCVYRKTIS